jgi:hypothetical protein
MATRATVAKNAPTRESAAKKVRRRDDKREARGASRKAKAASAPVLTLKAVFEQLGEARGLPKKQAHGMLAEFVAAMTTHLRGGDRIRMSAMSAPGILEGPGCPHGP